MKYLKTIALAWIPLISSCAVQPVSYQGDIKPIINNKCAECHTPPNGNGYRATGLMMGSYENLMQGSVYGPIVIAGDSQRSILNMLVEGRAGNVQSNLHNNGKELSKDEIEAFRAWVEQGALDN
jgi:hypothetical protein